MSGNTSEIGDAGESPGKSSLFFLTIQCTLESDCPAIRFSDWESGTFLYRPVRFRRSVKTRWRDLFAPLVVLITASGLQGVQPLVDRTM